MTWQAGKDKIQELLDAGELESVAADVSAADRLLHTAGLHLHSAQLLSDSGDLAGAYQVAYDGLRKSAAALLAAQGLRATSRGGHIALQDAVMAQFGRAVPSFRSFSRIRRTRNEFEYPGESGAMPVIADVEDAIKAGQGIHKGVSAILAQGILDAW